MDLLAALKVFLIMEAIINIILVFILAFILVFSNLNGLPISPQDNSRCYRGGVDWTAFMFVALMSEA